MPAVAPVRPRPQARDELRFRFEDDLGDVLDDAMIVVSELVNNAVVHGEGRITLDLRRTGDRLRVEVVDEGTGEAPAIRQRAQADAVGGWGLHIVGVLSEAWGAHEGTTHVWAEIALPAR
jgi:LytS/YehU family sensor histidine kinase